MEGLGEKFQKARNARNLTLDEAARMTKIRPNKLAEIEAEDFSHFPSLAYAKGFVLIYGKFLNVDVNPYLEAFETSEHMTVDGYSYLQDNPAPKPRRTEVVRRQTGGNKSSLLPLVIGIVVLIAGFTLLRLLMDVRRVSKPSGRERDAQALAQASVAAPAVNDTGSRVVAPRALPLDSPPTASPNNATQIATPALAPSAPPTATPPVVTPPSNVPAATTDEPEVRRAEPVHPEDLAKSPGTASAGSAVPGVNRFEIRPLKKTFVKVVVDDQPGGSSFSRALDTAGAPVQLTGKKITVKLLDPTSVEIRKNGKLVSRSDADVRLE